MSYRVRFGGPIRPRGVETPPLRSTKNHSIRPEWVYYRLMNALLLSRALFIEMHFLLADAIVCFDPCESVSGGDGDGLGHC
jgi:hypothetical protein